MQQESRQDLLQALADVQQELSTVRKQRESALDEVRSQTLCGLLCSVETDDVSHRRRR
jgi:hypothetical protein